MLQARYGRIDYDEAGAGPTIVFVPGSWATGSAWRNIIAALEGRFRTVTTSLPGYGGTRDSERGSTRLREPGNTMTRTSLTAAYCISCRSWMGLLTTFSLRYEKDLLRVYRRT